MRLHEISPHGASLPLKVPNTPDLAQDPQFIWPIACSLVGGRGGCLRLHWRCYRPAGALSVGVEVTRLACQRATEEDLKAIEENVEASAAAVAADNVDERLEVNLAFHVLLARAAKNPLLMILVEALTDVQSKLLQVITPFAGNKVVQSRRRLLKHLRARDEDAAVREMQAHLTALHRHYLTQGSVARRDHQ